MFHNCTEKESFLASFMGMCNLFVLRDKIRCLPPPDYQMVFPQAYTRPKHISRTSDAVFVRINHCIQTVTALWKLSQFCQQWNKQIDWDDACVTWWLTMRVCNVDVFSCGIELYPCIQSWKKCDLVKKCSLSTYDV